MGLFASLLSALLSSSKDLLSKRLAYRIDGTTSTFASFAFALPYYAVVLAVLYAFDERTFAWSLTFFVLVFLRSVTDTLAEGLKMHAFAHGEISLVACFFSISPLFLLVTAPLITGDETSLVGALAVIAVVVGSLLVTYRPSETGWRRQKRAILLATTAAFFFSLNSCFDRRAMQLGTPLGGDVWTAVFAGFTMTLLSALFLLPLVLRRDRLHDLRTHAGGLWLRGLLEVGFMVCKLYALQFMHATHVAGIQRLSLVFSIIGARIAFGEPDFARRMLAATLIVGGAFLIACLEL